MKKKILVLILALFIIVIVFCGCEREATIVNRNLGKEADNFNIMRRLAVINARTDKPLFEMEGRFSLSNNDTNELVITVEVAPGEYKKHFVYLNDYTMYVVEDISGANVSQYHYEINFIPEMIIPFTFTAND